MVTQPLVEPVLDLERTSGERPRGNRLLLWGFLMMFIGAAIGIIGKKLLQQDVVTVVGVLISLAGMFLTVYPYLVPSRTQKNESSPRSRLEPLTSSPPAKSLRQGSEDYLPSITERTTDLLKVPTDRKAGKN